MAEQPDGPRTRRAFLLALAGGLGAWAAGLAERATPVAAANGGNVILGNSNSATATTTVANSGTSGNGISGTISSTSATAAGVYGSTGSNANYGVYAAGKLGASGPLELANLTITNYAGPGSGKIFLYAKTNGSVVELHAKFPSGIDKIITSA